MTLERACERWWDEVGQFGAETDLEDALDWLAQTIGGKRPLHTIRGDDIARAVTERRKCVVKAGRNDKGVQLYRPVSARTVNRTVPLLLRRVMNCAEALLERSHNHDAGLGKTPALRRKTPGPRDHHRGRGQNSTGPIATTIGRSGNLRH